MLFLTYWFVLFIAGLYPLYWFLPFRRVRLTILLIGCSVFHTHFAGPAGVLPIVILAAITYLVGLTRNRTACAAGIAASAGALIYYKYVKFLFLQVVGALVPETASHWVGGHPRLLSPIPPLAISFFAFEFIHYLVDVGRGGPPIRKLRDFSLYTLFWPSIVAGPVKRYQQFLGALNQGVRSVNSHDVAVGAVRVALGLAKKMAADTLTAWLTSQVAGFAQLDILWRWFFVLCLGLRILWDFSGYSDMAIGFARMHGIRLPENFNWPYLAQSLTDFWHRWHMSLSLWIRDYVYIPLGGSRLGLPRKIVNGLLAFGICGLWHGAGWNFLVWGVYHGAGLAVNANYRTLLGPLGRAIGDRMARHAPVAWGLNMVYVGVGWLFFFFPVPVAARMLQLLFTRAE